MSKIQLIALLSMGMLWGTSCSQPHKKTNPPAQNSIVVPNEPLVVDTPITVPQEERKPTSQPPLIEMVGPNYAPGRLKQILHRELSDQDIYNDSILYGYWFQPHEASDINIFFHRDGQFEMNYYYTDKDGEHAYAYEVGHFTQRGHSVYLSGEDGWKMTLFYGDPFPKGHPGANSGNYITRKANKREGIKELYLVKGSH